MSQSAAFKITRALTRYVSTFARAPGRAGLLHGLEIALWAGPVIFVLGFDGAGLPAPLIAAVLYLGGGLVQAVIASGWYRLLADPHAAGFPLRVGGVELKVWAVVLIAGAGLAALFIGLITIEAPAWAGFAALAAIGILAVRIAPIAAVIVKTGELRPGATIRETGAIWGRLISVFGLWMIVTALVLPSWYALYFTAIWEGGGEAAAIALIVLGAAIGSVLAGWARGMASEAGRALGVSAARTPAVLASLKPNRPSTSSAAPGRVRASV